MSQMTGYGSSLVPSPQYRRPRPSAVALPVAESLISDPPEGRFPTILGFLTAAYLVSVCTMSAGAVSWVPQVVGIILGVSWVVIGLFLKAQPIRWAWTMTFFFLYLVWAGTGFFITENQEYFMVLYGTQIKVCLVTWVCFQCVKTRRDFLLCCLFLGIAGGFVLVQGLDSIIRAVEFSGGRETKESRASGTLLSNANTLGQFGVIVIFGVSACLMGYKSKIVRVLCVLLGIAGLYIVTASGSRMAMLGVVTLAAAVYWYHFRKAGGSAFGRRIMLVIMGILLVAGSIVFVTKMPLFYRLVDVFSSKENLQKEPRIEYFFRAMDVTAEHPMIGLGMGGFAIAGLGRSAKGHGHYSHSSISETLAATGIPGFLIYFSGLLTLFVLLRQTRTLNLSGPDKAAVNVIMAFFWVILLFNTVGVQDQDRLLWPLTGAALGYVWNLRQRYSYTAPNLAAA
jgi:O-antigen ligase/polysaccharide polymerase Wzy-like membrane protein